MQRIPRYPLTTGGQENIRSNTGVHLPGNDWILLLVQYIGFLPFLLCLLQHSGSRIDCTVYLVGPAGFYVKWICLSFMFIATF